jgi:hypothetical protein
MQHPEIILENVESLRHELEQVQQLNDSKTYSQWLEGEKDNNISQRINLLKQEARQLKKLDSSKVTYIQWLDVRFNIVEARLKQHNQDVITKQKNIGDQNQRFSCEWDQALKALQKKELDVMIQQANLSAELLGFLSSRPRRRNSLLCIVRCYGIQTTSTPAVIDAMMYFLNWIQLKEKEIHLEMLSSTSMNTRDLQPSSSHRNLEAVLNAEKDEVKVLKQIEDIIGFQMRMEGVEQLSIDLRREVVRLELELNKVKIDRLNRKLKWQR